MERNFSPVRIVLSLRLDDRGVDLYELAGVPQPRYAEQRSGRNSITKPFLHHAPDRSEIGVAPDDIDAKARTK